MVEYLVVASEETEEQREKALELLADFQSGNMVKYDKLEFQQRIAVFMHLRKIGFLGRITFQEWRTLIEWVKKAAKCDDEVECFFYLLGIDKIVLDHWLNAS